MNNYQLAVKKYPLYKDSKVDWLRDIPEHWESRRLKDICTYTKGYAFKSDDFIDSGIPIVKATDIKQYRILESTSFIDSSRIESYKNVLLKDNDIVISTVGSQPNIVDSAVGQLASIDKRIAGSLLNQNTVIIRINKKGIDNKFLYYNLISKSFRQHLDTIARGTANQSSIKISETLEYCLFLPTSKEQKSIATYLDTKTAQCDRKIVLLTQKATQYGKLKQSLINETVTRGLDKSVLKKDSGVEWIGEVPEHWEVVRNKQIFQERSILSSTGKETLLTVSHITGVTPRSEKNVNMFMAETMEGYKICHQGDLIINTMWAWMGALGTSKYFGICSPAYNVYMPVNNVPYDYRYFDYLYRTPNAVVEMTRN
jgi:type I restriction enzyme S subunit